MYPKYRILLMKGRVQSTMGQEAGKTTWPKSSRRYRTITGRRYGRRYAYVGFTPSSNSQVRDEHQHNEDCKQLELEDIQKENSLRPSPPVQVSSGLLDEPLLENTGTGEPLCESVSSQTLEANTSPFSLFSYGLEGNQISGNFMNPYENSEDLVEYATDGCNVWNGQNGIAFVNVDSYEPDGGDREDPAQDEFSLGTEEAVVFRETINKIFSEFEKGIESFTELQSQSSNLNHSVTRECCEETGPMPLMRYFSIDSDLACPNNRTFKTSAEDQAILKSNPSDAVHELQQIKNISTESVEIQAPIAIANELNVSEDQGNSLELVVRPKIRKQNTSNQLERERLLLNDKEGENSSWRSEIDEVQQGCAECALNSKEMSSSMFFGSRGHEGHRKNTELRKNAAAQERKGILEDNTFWDGFEDCSRHFSMYHKDEDRTIVYGLRAMRAFKFCLAESSECSDGEWSAGAPTYFTATEKDHSSDESWETIPRREKCEPEVQNSSSNGVEEENKDYCSQGGEQTLLEEGEIPRLQYQEEAENISDEENNLIHDFVYPGFFLLDGNNNLEDDSSVSEDLDVEWRLLNEFGDGLGLAQAVPDVDPLTLEALEGRLQEAMETALAHLELLGFDVEQAHPPATKETIDSLPQIIITNDQDGQEQRCTICCSEYVENEIITELPCHHLFHRTCVTLWLQESGTCPVCRHVLAPVPSETAAATVSFLPDPDSASSVHSVTGTSN
ncbi:E3 ubiquitin-protein ligase Praja-2 isoform X3 [Strigops habroptila]|uniref:E3 ubiquitin-protein ligase Praja-2 isoform X3 n=1 Tax=Strigops habroptila TaxID=2489341 RepID=UPI0011CF7DA6|nr:E3 ubiquitin-protein ligase Praja-2 isoform X3 [Strigops habroptila]XP_030325661.1 E3 ubiquitin-protein ligase Praja-2 isoform X3 [Strigops habroptila]XP_030325662.1 E3 ubiquitin-protein ligase Praja-2 isoform X3 [Strigops habroptila]XP_030325663.1 E3 ubiquitin-protein ligase Praja-2 isoform X3 [Strigops habroptila]